MPGIQIQTDGCHLGMQYRLLLIIVTFGVTIYSNLFNIFGMNLGINAVWKTKFSVFNEVRVSGGGNK